MCLTNKFTLVIIQLPDNKMLALSKLKAFTDENYYCSNNAISLLNGGKHCRKLRKCW